MFYFVWMLILVRGVFRDVSVFVSSLVCACENVDGPCQCVLTTVVTR